MGYTVETDDIRIEYSFVDTSFEHAFGVQRQWSYDIERIEVYIPAIDEWLDMSHTSYFDKVASKLVEQDIDNLEPENRPHFTR